MNQKFTTTEQMINLIQATINLPETLFYGSRYLFFTCLY